MNWRDGLNQDEVHGSVLCHDDFRAHHCLAAAAPLLWLDCQTYSLLASEVGTLFVVSKGPKTSTWNEQTISVYPFI